MMDWLLGRAPSQRTQASAPPSLQKGPSPSQRERQFHAIADNYKTLDEVVAALRQAGLESSNLIVAVDFTKSNEWTGKQSFCGRCLHAAPRSAAEPPSPYEQAIAALGRTLQSFDDDNLIPAYGFGDALTSDQSVFSFLPGNAPCAGLDTVLQRYRALSGAVRLAGPTSFAPAIHTAMDVVIRSGGKYHILVIVADGQVTRSSDLPDGQPSPQEQATVRAITQASGLPLSIIMVGVGDGPWHMMRAFDDSLPQRAFDNFQFVNFTELAARFPAGPPAAAGSGGGAPAPPGQPPHHGPREAAFALRALMEVPEQYKCIQRLGLLSRPAVDIASLPKSVVLDPPPTPLAPTSPQGFPPTASHASGGVAQPPSHPPPTWGPGGPSAPSAPPPLGAFNVPEALFLCPITQDVMHDPVLAADGYSYEREAIQGWLKNKHISPMTNVPMPNTALIPNHALRSSIMEWRQRTQQPPTQRPP